MAKFFWLITSVLIPVMYQEKNIHIYPLFWCILCTLLLVQRKVCRLPGRIWYYKTFPCQRRMEEVGTNIEKFLHIWP